MRVRVNKRSEPSAGVEMVETLKWWKTPLNFKGKEVAEEEGFEPPVGLPTTVFKTAAFNHSATPPGMWGPEGSGSAEA